MESLMFTGFPLHRSDVIRTRGPYLPKANIGNICSAVTDSQKPVFYSIYAGFRFSLKIYYCLNKYIKV